MNRWNGWESAKGMLSFVQGSSGRGALEEYCGKYLLNIYRGIIIEISLYTDNFKCIAMQLSVVVLCWGSIECVGGVGIVPANWPSMLLNG